MYTIQRFTVGYLATNCYVLGDERGNAVVIDPGGGYDKIKAYIAEKGYELKAVLLTHGHFDHILALPRLAQDGAKVYIHRNDVPKLNNDGNLAGDVGLPPLQPVKPDVVLNGGETFKIGETQFKALFTPGHTSGSVCYLSECNLFSGDTLFRGSYGRTDFVDGNEEDMKKSLLRLFELPDDTAVYPGHGEFTTIEYEKKFNAVFD